MGAAAGENVLYVLKKCLNVRRLPGERVCKISVACFGVENKYSDASKSHSVLRCRSPTVPNRGGWWHSPMALFWGRLPVSGLLRYRPRPQDCAGSSRVGQDGWVLGVGTRGCWSIPDGLCLPPRAHGGVNRHRCWMWDHWGRCWPDPAASQGLPDPLRCPVAICSSWLWPRSHEATKLVASSSQSLRQLEEAEGKAGQEGWGAVLAGELLVSALLLLEIVCMKSKYLHS